MKNKSQMDVALELIENLKNSVETLNMEEINDTPNIIFLTAFQERLENLGIPEHIKGVTVNDVANSINVDFSQNTEKEVAEVIGIGFAEVVYDILRKLDGNFKFTQSVLSNLSAAFNIE